MSFQSWRRAESGLFDQLPIRLRRIDQTGFSGIEEDSQSSRGGEVIAPQLHSFGNRRRAQIGGNMDEILIVSIECHSPVRSLVSWPSRNGHPQSKPQRLPALRFAHPGRIWRKAVQFALRDNSVDDCFRRRSIPSVLANRESWLWNLPVFEFHKSHHGCPVFIGFNIQRLSGVARRCRSLGGRLDTCAG